MAPKTTSAPEPTEDATAQAEPQASVNGNSDAFNWDAMAQPIVMPTKAVVSQAVANVLETVPEPIRQRAEMSLALNAAAKAAHPRGSAKRARVPYHWEFQPVTDDKMAAAFDRLLTKYAKYRPNVQDIPFAHKDSPRGQITARTGAPGWFVRDESGELVPCQPTEPGAMYGLRYSVRPFEQRQDTARMPGTA